MHKLLETRDAVFMSYVEALLKADGIACERIPIVGVYVFGSPILCVAEEDAAQAEAVLEAAKAQREQADGP